MAVLRPCRRSARAAARCAAVRRRRRPRPARRARQTSSASVSAARPSPSAMRDQRRPRLGVERQRPCPRPSSARSRSLLERSPRRGVWKTSTVARDRSAALSSKDGFSVVAPTSMTVPSSMTGRKQSCWARLKRWISSTNSSVPWPVRAAPRAASNTFFRSATPEKIAEICSKARPVSPREQPRDRGLAGAGRPPEDHRAERARADQPRQRAVRAGQMLLARPLRRGCRAQPVGERARRPCSNPALAKRSVMRLCRPSRFARQGHAIRLDD